jgi:predicted CXXCH cytochrome family protein
MKRRAIIVVGVLALTGTAAYAGIAGTKHDLSAAGYGSTELCIFCHTPHNGMMSMAPLWNHQVTSATFTPYTSSTLDADTSGGPGKESKACLSCHDGTVGIGSFGTITTNTNYMPTTGSYGNPNLGTDLSNDHPIGFTYDSALSVADPGVFDPGTDANGTGPNLRPAGVGPRLFYSKMECASCHLVHDNTNAPFLRMTNSGSGMCLRCHNK